MITYRRKYYRLFYFDFLTGVYKFLVLKRFSLINLTIRYDKYYDYLSYWFSMSFFFKLFFISLRGSSVIYHIFWILINFFQIFDELSLWRASAWIHQVSELILIITFFIFSTSRKNMNRTTRYFQGFDFFLFNILFWWSWARQRKFHKSDFNRPLKARKTTNRTTSWSWLYVYIDRIATSITNIFKRQEIWSSYTKKNMTIKNW